MKRILWIVALAIAISAPAFAQSGQAAGNDKLAQELAKFTQETIMAFQNNDVAALDHLLADDLIGTNQAGESYDKAALIGLIKSGQLKYESVAIEPERSSLHGDVMIASSMVKT